MKLRPSELVFGHFVDGPLKVLQEEFLSPSPVKTSVRNNLDYISSFHECLHTACELGKCSPATSQSRMKTCYDRKAVVCPFQA